MNTAELVQTNLTSPMVLAFALGLLAATARSNLRFPPGMYAGLSMYLLLAIGLKGGAALREAGLGAVLVPGLGTVCLGLAIPTGVYFVARKLGRLSVEDAAAMAAHYGSTSVVTFVAASVFLSAAGVSSEAFMPALVAVLEVPAIVVALLFANMRGETSGNARQALREVVLGPSVVLLLGGVAMGTLSGKDGVAQVDAFFVAPFKGALTLFMLELGLVAAQHLRSVRQHSAFLLSFGIGMPIAQGALGVWVGGICGLTPGGAMLMGTLAASASYIAAPAAVRIALPRANPGLYLTSSLGVTFPFNLAVGIPLYYTFATTGPQRLLAAIWGGLST
jgi:uncharacterized protein